MKILLIDELEIIRDGLELILRDYFTVERIVHASDGSEALAKAVKDCFQLVLMDLSIPGDPDGPETLLKLRTLLPEGKIVVFTMLNEEIYERNAFHSGADGFLGKKLKGEEIIHGLMEILRGHKVFNEKIILDSSGRARKKGSPLELPISQREKEVFLFTLQGFSQKEIAEKMGISIRTVENHRQHIGKKLGTHKKRDWLDIARMYHFPV